MDYARTAPAYEEKLKLIPPSVLAKQLPHFQVLSPIQKVTLKNMKKFYQVNSSLDAVTAGEDHDNDDEDGGDIQISSLSH